MLRRGIASASLAIASTLLALLLCELALRAVFDPGDFLMATLVADPILGQRIAPGTTGHDALGFRNAEVPPQAGIVVIGDSQTYGVGAARAESWPAQLAGLLGEPVYNMALGGYGPLDYLYLADHLAPELHPRTLVVGLYFGNDLVDAHHAANRRAYWRGWRAASEAAEQASGPEPAQTRGAPKRLGALRDWLSRHSVFYSVLRETLLRRLAVVEKRSLASQVPPDVQFVWSDPDAGSTRTIFTPRLRLAGLDPQSPQVREGLRITEQAFAALQELALARGQDVLVVLIPTKEQAYCRYVESTTPDLPAAFRQLCRAEGDARSAMASFLAERGIRSLDVTPALEAAVREHAQIYPQHDDGHPLAAGYGVIARAVEAELRCRDGASGC